MVDRSFMNSNDVIAIVDPNFGDELATLPKVNIWSCSSEENSRAVLTLRKTDANLRFESLTENLFAVKNDDDLLSLLGSIEDHHSEYSPPAWLHLELIGASLTSTVAKYFKDLGVSDLKPTARGFIVTRASGSGRRKDNTNG